MSGIKKNLLIEIGVEELPIASLESSVKTLGELVRNQLVEYEFLDEIKPSNLQNSDKDIWVSPRRIAICIENVSNYSHQKLIVKRGPKKETNNMILEKFASTNGIKIKDLVVESTDKGDYYFAKIKEPAKKIDDEIAKIISQSLKSIATKKSMRWADFDYQFLRPIHWIVALHGKTTLRGKVWGIELGNQSRGHRFHHPNSVVIDDEKNYLSQLKKAKVIVSKKQRGKSIINQILAHFPEAKERTQSLKHYAREVSNLVEWPVVLVGDISKKYLNELPVEVIETILFKHQFCFIPYKKGVKKELMQNASEILEPHFITVSNLMSKNNQLVIEGYQKVITARLEDGLFFYKNDSAMGKFENLNNQLERLVFHNQLGSYKNKTIRMKQLAKEIVVNETSKTQNQLFKAIDLCKNDLLTQSVIEMPSLQGIFGAYLSAQFLDDQEIIFAIKDQYQPISRYDDLPAFKVGKLLALIDKLDTLTGLWLAGLAPRGSKDPFALRRTALAIIRLLSEGELNLNLSIRNLLIESFKVYQNQNAALIKNQTQCIAEIEAFISERMGVYFVVKYQQTPKDLVQSVINNSVQLNLSAIDKKINSLANFYRKHSNQLTNVLVTYKRISNLVKNVNLDLSTKLSPSQLHTKAEKDLINQLKGYQNHDELTANLNQLSGFFQLVENFLENVQINCKDKELKFQRQLLVLKIKKLFDGLEIDFNCIQSI